MSITSLQIHGVRNLNDISLTLDPRFNFFIGENGSGKTSLLEAIYLLGTSRSFRTHLYHKVVNYDQKQLTVFGELLLSNGNPVYLGVQKEKDGTTQIKIDHLPCRQSAHLAQYLPLQLYYPDSFKIIDASPQIRREMLDWGVFHQQADYFKLWGDYQRILKQRNAWLRDSRNRRVALCPWDKLLSDQATRIHQSRQDYFQQFLPIFEDVMSRFLDEPLEIVYFKGWREKENFSEALLHCLEKDRERDIYLGYTQHGPHKADIIIQQRGHAVKDFFSRGQQKLVIIAIKIAQGLLLSQITGKSCVYLLDDVFAEFDATHWQTVMNFLSEIPGQIFFTGLSEDIFKTIPFFDQGKMFHVKHGGVHEN